MDGWVQWGSHPNLGKVAVRPCKLPCWELENSHSSPTTVPSTRNLVHPRSLPQPGMKFNLAFLPLRCFYREKKVTVCREKNSNSPETVTWPGAKCLKLQTVQPASKSLNSLLIHIIKSMYTYTCRCPRLLCLCRMVNDRIIVLAVAYMGVYEGLEPTTIIQVCFVFFFLLASSFSFHINR